jgi:hypothetical protein
VAAEDEMTIDERRKYLKKMQPRYQTADRAGRSSLLTEMAAVTGFHRKSLIRLLAAPTLERRPRDRPRGRTYAAEVRAVGALVWESLDYICAERLTPALAATARHLAAFGECRLTPAVEAQLGRISRATVQRMLHTMARPTPRLPRGGPEQANHARRDVPMGRLPWDTATPGHFEVALVHHCGSSTVGEYVHTWQLVALGEDRQRPVAALPANVSAQRLRRGDAPQSAKARRHQRANGLTGPALARGTPEPPYRTVPRFGERIVGPGEHRCAPLRLPLPGEERGQPLAQHPVGDVPPALPAADGRPPLAPMAHATSACVTP